jgi:hypothetical protein
VNVNFERHDIQHNDTQQNDIQHNNIQYNDTQHNSKLNTTLSCYAVLLSVIYDVCCKQAHYAECRYAECRGAQNWYEAKLNKEKLVLNFFLFKTV